MSSEIITVLAIERQAAISIPPFQDISRVTLNGLEVGRQGTTENPRRFYSKTLYGVLMHPPLSKSDVIEIEYIPTTDPITSYYDESYLP
ncbi:MAG: hypothetical protein KUL86_06920 [Castellaniella sp.]|nr:hypothetical protein [Castellaniella sp.]